MLVGRVGGENHPCWEGNVGFLIASYFFIVVYYGTGADIHISHLPYIHCIYDVNPLIGTELLGGAIGSRV